MIIEDKLKVEEEIIKLFLLNMNLLTPAQREIMVKLLERLFLEPLPVEEEYIKSRK